jgi:hypothetical protein
MDMAQQVREILSARGLTLYNVSRRSVEIFGRSSKFRVSQNLYSDLANLSLKPTIYQILALSHITHYRLADWLKVFDLDLDTISRLQLRIPRRRTTLLDSNIYDTYAWIPWFAEGTHSGPPPAIAPLRHLLASSPSRRARDLLALNKQRFRYAVVGEQDLYALPYFVPRSIIRADPRRAQELPFRHNANQEGPFFLVEHNFGWTCSRVILLGKDRILLHCPQRPCTERELRIGRDARVLGAVDAEIRPVISHGPKHLMSAPWTSRKPRHDHRRGEQIGLKHLLRRSRIVVGLSFREASSISRLIADSLSDEFYFTAASTLSDYEVLPAPPRHVQKIITLCLLYCIDFHEFLRASGLPLDKAGRGPIPDELLPSRTPAGNQAFRASSQDSMRESSGFLAALVNQWEEVPLFLRFSLDAITGLKGFSLSDLFWVGGDKAKLHPLLINATLVVVNRRARRPSPPKQDAVCEERLHLILKRDGSYLCGRCSLDEGNLVIHGYPGGPVGTQQFRDGIDAEVVGQVTAIVRRLP